MKAAEQGNADAQYKLGKCYYDGDGVAQDHIEAVKRFKKAAEKGYADAQCALVACCYVGDGVEQDHAESAKWLEKAAEHYLGVEAVKWLEKAAEQGHLLKCRLYLLCTTGDHVFDRAC